MQQAVATVIRPFTFNRFNFTLLATGAVARLGHCSGGAGRDGDR
jgi:hypothetical protein